jgi:hypothetical protein
VTGVCLSVCPSRNSDMPDTPLQIKGRKMSVRPPNCVKLCALTPNICYNCSSSMLQLKHTTTVSVQMLALVPEIMELNNKEIYIYIYIYI